jgi:uncharacterized membrane protein
MTFASPLWFGILLGGILALGGIVVYFLAPRVGPNPIFGVRVGYAYASREVWDRTNRFGGALLVSIGIVTLIGGLVLQLFTDPRTGMVVLTAVMIAGLIGATGWMIAYARSLAQGAPEARMFAPVRFNWLYLAPTLLTFAALVAVMLWFYPQLPVERMATHFGFDDQPNGWMTRDGFVLTFLGLSALFVVLNLVVVLVSTREPVLAIGRWGDRWLLTPERGLVFTGMMLALANLIFIVVLFDVGWFNTRGAHLFPLGWLIALIVPVVVIAFGLFFVLAPRTDSNRTEKSSGI